jgi:ribonuclease P/MRP protein subunit RPP1
LKRYIDLHINPKTGEAERLITEAKYLGYNCVASTVNIRPETSIDIDVATRVDLEPRRGSDLLDQLKKVRSRFEVVAVKCTNKDVARQAAKDHRVDILLFSEDLTIRRNARLDTQEAQLASEVGCCYEINASELLFSGENRLARLTNVIKRELEIARRFDIPIILSSGASTSIGLREPKALAAMTFLLDISEETVVEMQTTTPDQLLKKNRAKLSKEYISPGVRRVTDAS